METSIITLAFKDTKARKLHFCQECKAGIFRGKIYYAATTESHGKYLTYRVCSKCMEAWRAVKTEKVLKVFGDKCFYIYILFQDTKK